MGQQSEPFVTDEGHSDALGSAEGLWESGTSLVSAADRLG